MTYALAPTLVIPDLTRFAVAFGGAQVGNLSFMDSGFPLSRE